MAIEVPPVRVPRRGPPPGVAAALLVVLLGAVVGVGLIGRARAPESSAQPVPATERASAATSAPASEPAPASIGVELTTPSFAPGPTAAPLVIRGGIPSIRTSAARLLSEPPDVRTPARKPPGPGIGYWGGTVDGRGMLWLIGAGRLARYDPATHDVSAWTEAEDERFTARAIVPSARGGVWLVGAQTLRLFRGTGFGAAIDVGAEITAAAEAPDGAILAATAGGVIARVADGSVTRIDALAPDRAAVVAAIAVSTDGDIWCGWRAQASSGTGWVSRFDGTVWHVYGAGEGAPLDAGVRTIVAAPDGSVWVATDRGLVRFASGEWSDFTTRQPLGGRAPDAIAAGPGDSLWLAVGTQLAEFSGTRLESSVTVAGLSLQRGPITWLAPTGSGVFGAPGAGLYELGGGRWRRLWPVTQRTDLGFAVPS